MITDKNIKWVIAKVAPSVKEADYWVDTKEDPKGSVIKYHNGKNWVALNQKLSTEEVKKMISAAFDKLDITKANKTEIEHLTTLVNKLTKRVKELEQLIA